MKQRGVATISFFLLLFCAAPFAGAQGTSQQAPKEQAPVQAASEQRAKTPRELAEERADLHMVRKEYALAIQGYEELLEREPEKAKLLNKIGIAYQQIGNLSKAVKYYKKSAKADKLYPEPLNNMGTVYYQRRNDGKAIRYYQKALKIQPMMATVLSNMGYAYFRKKKYPEALAAFRQAIVLDPGILERTSRVGSLLQDRSVKNAGFFYFFLARAFATMGNSERCAYYLRKARDEGYEKIRDVTKDPAFAEMLKDPAVQEILQSTEPAGVQPKSPGASL